MPAVTGDAEYEIKSGERIAYQQKGTQIYLKRISQVPSDNGKLYSTVSTRGGNISMGRESYSITRENENKYILEATVEVYDLPVDKVILKNSGRDFVSARIFIFLRL